MKKLLAMLCALLLALGLAGCTTQHDDLYDNDSAIASENNRYMVVKFFGSLPGENQYDFSVSSITGARTLWKFNAQGEEEVTLSASLAESNGGRVKLVLVSPSGAVTTLAEASASSDSDDYTFTAQPGVWQAKLVGAEEPTLEGSLRFSHGNVSTD